MNEISEEAMTELAVHIITNLPENYNFSLLVYNDDDDMKVSYISSNDRKLSLKIMSSFIQHNLNL